MENGTMQEQMQPLLASAELRAVADYIRDYAIFLLDSEGTVLTWNTGAQRIKGYEADDIIGRSFTRFYTDEDRAARRPQHHLEVAAREGRIEVEGWRVRKDGSRFWADVVVSPIYGDGGEVQGFVKVTRDLTERKRAAEELAERSRQQFAVSELGLRALQTHELPAVMDAAIRIARDTLHIEDVRLLGPTEPPPPTANTALIHAPEEKAQAYGVLAAMSERPFSANQRSFLEAVANVVAAAIARKRIEEQLRVAERLTTEERGRTEQAEAALRERDEFISVAAHELRTPLTALQLKLQGLERGLAATDPRKVQRLEGAVRQTERLSRLIDRLLDVSRIAQGRLELWPEEFDLAALVRQVAEDFREPAAQARAPLELQLPDKAEGSWDRLRIEQVLVNVVSNAVKYGAGRPVSVKLEVEEDRVRLAVRDQGIGIPAEDASRIFGRFQRAASIRNYGGLGLGLYITRHIVEAHRGTIAVASAVGEGSTFSIDLPRFSLTPAANRNKVRPARA
jgi:PAS domain S-box-containing protein